MPSHNRRSRRRALSSLLFIVLATALPLRSARASVATGISDPPPYARQALPADTVAADPFTKSAPGLVTGQIEMTTLSAPPSLVSGGRARIEIRGLAADDVLTVKRDGTDVTDVFLPVAGEPLAE